MKLEQNYRSTVRILRSANALIANNPKLFDKKLWSEHGHGDPDPGYAGGRRRGRGRRRRAPPHGASLRASRPLRRLRDPLPRQPSGEDVRAAAARAERAVRDLRRTVVFRARRDQGHRRVSPAHRQRRRRSGLHPRRDHAEARRRRDDAGEAGRRRRRAARESLRRRVRRRSAHRGSGAAARDPRRVLHVDQRLAPSRGARARGAPARRARRGDRVRGFPGFDLRSQAGGDALAERPRFRRAGFRPRARRTARTSSS